MPINSDLFTDCNLGQPTPIGSVSVVKPPSEGLDSRAMDHDRIPLSRSSLRTEDFETGTAVLQSGNLVQGFEVAKLEAFLANNRRLSYAIEILDLRVNGTARALDHVAESIRLLFSNSISPMSSLVE